MLVDIKHLNFSYSGTQEILSDINLSIEAGCFLGILGQNGAGKSTLLKCINKLHAATSGDVFLDGKNINEMSLREIAQKVAYVPQSTLSQFPTTVMNLVLLGRLPYSGYSFTNKDRKHAMHAMQEMGLEKYMMSDICHLSGGERQRAFIARALAGSPQIILMDEPTSSLDVHHQLEVLARIRGLVRKSNIAVVMVIHDLNMAAMFCDRLVLLKDAKIYKDGSPNQVLTEESINEIYHVRSFTMDRFGKRYIQLLDPDLY